jgi:hypothetical protein
MSHYYDPIPYDQVAELIDKAEPSQQSGALHNAWRSYAAKAVRPYAWKTFAQYAREHFMETGNWSPKRGKERLTPWQDGARASPRVLFLGAYAALRVRGGALEIEHGPYDNRVTIRFDVDVEPKPHSILFDSHGEFMTGEAIRWCARYSINLLLPAGPGRIITLVESALETKTNTMTRMRDIDPMIIRAQCAADSVKMAREHLCLVVIQRFNVDSRDAGDVEQSSHPVSQRLDARVAKSDNDSPVVQQRRIEDGPKHVENNRLMFLLGAIDGVDVEDGRASYSNLN